VSISEKKHLYFLPIRQSYGCGKKRWFLRRSSLSEETQARLQKEFLFRTDSDFCSEQLWKMPKYFVYFKNSEGSYEEKDWLFRKESASKVSH